MLQGLHKALSVRIHTVLPSALIPGLIWPQIYQRAGYKAFRDAHAARGADFAAAVSGTVHMDVSNLRSSFFLTCT